MIQRLVLFLYLTILSGSASVWAGDESTVRIPNLLSATQLEQLPNEAILRILNQMDGDALFQMTQVSQKFRNLVKANTTLKSKVEDYLQTQQTQNLQHNSGSQDSRTSLSIQDLPPEVMEQILSRLGSADLASMSVASKQFQMLSEYQWKRLCKILVQKNAVKSKSEAKNIANSVYFEKEFNRLSRSHSDQDKWTWRNLFVLIAKIQVNPEDLKIIGVQKCITSFPPSAQMVPAPSNPGLIHQLSSYLASNKATVTKTALWGVTFGTAFALGYMYDISDHAMAAVTGLSMFGLTVLAVDASKDKIQDDSDKLPDEELDQYEQGVNLDQFILAVIQEYEAKFGKIPEFILSIPGPIGG
jgi:hypothetical protein